MDGFQRSRPTLKFSRRADANARARETVSQSQAQHLIISKHERTRNGQAPTPAILSVAALRHYLPHPTSQY